MISPRKTRSILRLIPLPTYLPIRRASTTIFTMSDKTFKHPLGNVRLLDLTNYAVWKEELHESPTRNHDKGHRDGERRRTRRSRKTQRFYQTPSSGMKGIQGLQATEVAGHGHH